MEHRSRSSSIAWFAIAALGAGCGGASTQAREASFGAAVEAAADESWVSAARDAYRFASATSAEQEQYDRALLILARSLERMGLTYAASLWYLDIAHSRRNVELVAPATEGLERIVEKTDYDRLTLEEGFLARAEVSDAGPKATPFLSYQQGLDSLKRGLTKWADKQFAAIPSDSPYAKRAQFAQAVAKIADGDLSEGRRELRALLDKGSLPTDVKEEASIALARLALERKKYREAIRRYQSVGHLTARRPELLLEAAWAYYYSGDSRRALGSLIALDAPAYGRIIAPERYLLEALSLRRLCQFEPARVAATRLKVRYRDALSDLHQGTPPHQSEALLEASRRRGEARDSARLYRMLQREREIVEDNARAFGDEFNKELLRIYDTGLAEARRRETADLRRESRLLAQELVRAEDGVRLVLHDLSVGLLRGRERPLGPPEAGAVNLSASADRVSYQFIGEFWTDELDDLVVTIEDRCLK